MQIAKADPLVLGFSTGKDSFQYGWSWNQGTHNHWTKGNDDAWGKKDVNDDGQGIADDAALMPPFEPGWNGTDDKTLEKQKAARGKKKTRPDETWPDFPDEWDLPELFFGRLEIGPIEAEAIHYAAPLIKEDKFLEHDWGNPGKQHKGIWWND